MTKCVICQNDFEGIGANPDPVSLYGVCCNTCDITGRLCITNLIHLGKKPQETIKLISKADKIKNVDLINERNYYGDLCKG